MKKVTLKKTTTSEVASLTSYVRVHGPAVANARAGMAQFAQEVSAMVACLRAAILAGEVEPLTREQYDGMREDFAQPLGYLAPSAERGARGSETYKAHDARDTYYRQSLGLVRLSPNAKLAAKADAAINGTKSAKVTARKARPATGPTLRINALLAAAIERAKARGIVTSAMVAALDALPGAPKA